MLHSYEGFQHVQMLRLVKDSKQEVKNERHVLGVQPVVRQQDVEHSKGQLQVLDEHVFEYFG